MIPNLVTRQLLKIQQPSIYAHMYTYIDTYIDTYTHLHRYTKVLGAVRTRGTTFRVASAARRLSYHLWPYTITHAQCESERKRNNLHWI